MTYIKPKPSHPGGKIERTSTYRSLAEFQGKVVPAREWYIHDLIPMSQVTLLSGDGGAGKSLLLLQAAIAGASGRLWLNRAVRPGSAIFLSAEDDEAELHRRTDAILRAEGLTYDDVKGVTIRSLAGEDALLAVESETQLIRTALLDELDQRVADEAPDLVVIDTAADTYPANENDRAKVRQFVGLLRGLAIRRRCAVVLLGHPSLTGLASGSGTSGSTAWNNSVRARLYLSRIDDNDRAANSAKRVLSVRKSNYGPVGGEITMTWRDGLFWADETAAPHLDRMAANAKAERVFIKLLDIFTVQNRRVNHAGSTSYAPRVFAEHPESEGINRTAFRTAMESLLANGRIKVAIIGPPSRRVSFLAIA